MKAGISPEKSFMILSSCGKPTSRNSDHSLIFELIFMS